VNGLAHTRWLDALIDVLISTHYNTRTCR